LPTKLIEGKSIPRDSSVSIGIDQSLTGFGLTILSNDDPTQYLTWVYKSPYFGIERLADIRQWLTDNLGYAEDNWTITDIGMEGTVLASQAALVLGELSATVRLAIFDFFEEYDDRRFPLKVPPMTLKKYAAGKGNAKKQEMLLQIFKRWGVEFNDDNAADSYAIARLVSKTSQDAVEKAVVEQMSDPKYRDQPRI
jgi:Holliday junction resolvasome RuvABC endonuclease subunit